MGDPDLLADALAAKVPRASHPPGWEPHVEEYGATASAVSKPTDGSPSHDDLIRGWDMDPAEWQIVGDVQVRRWQTYDERWLRYFRANLTRVRKGDQADVDALAKTIMGRRYKRPTDTRDDGWAAVACLGDWQIGKGEGGGTPALVDALGESFARLDDLWKRSKPPAIHLPIVGDITERIAGNYASQAFTVDCDERQQKRIARRLLMEIVTIAARRAPRVVVEAVPCNHGENRDGAGKRHSNVTDNISLELAENTSETCAAHPDLGHVEFRLAPCNHVVSDMAGIGVVITHGHDFPGGAGAMGKAVAWWAGQSFGLQPSAAATMMIYGHHHHFQMSEEPGRTILGCPAMDGGSEWFTGMTGKSSPRGLVSVSVGAGIGDPLKGERPWDDLRIL